MREWNGKRVAVIGLGISNIPLIRFLLRKGACISGRDRKSAQELGERYSLLEKLGVQCQLGKDYLLGLDSYDAVFLTPGIPKNLPEIAALRGKVPLLSEIALVLEHARAPVLGVTGSSGKTTTTTLIGEMLKSSGLETYVGGNIGTPLIEQVESIPPSARIVLELSSFQLEMLSLSPQVALVTNVSENHLDVHGTMENYITAKKQIYRHQIPDDAAVFNYNDPVTRQMAAECPSRVHFFSSKQPVERGTFLSGDWLIYSDGKESFPILRRDRISLRGMHNVENVLAASLTAHLAGASWEAVRQVAESFAGVPHRLEKIREYQGVVYYNDSIATTPTRSMAALHSFDQPIILIAGGYDKKLSFSQYADVVAQKVKKIYVLGETAAKIIDAIEVSRRRLGTAPEIERVENMEEAVTKASEAAVPGDVVLLSPACASFDMYPNYEIRGDHFRELVWELKEA